ncbi:MAG: hypothetical protein V9E96_20790 [Chitinophagaceae bacterium]
MPSTSETGHAKNVANFETLVSFCSGYGATYNPSRDALKVTNLQTLLTASKAAIADCKANETTFDNATHARMDAYSNLKSLGTRIVNALSVSGVADTVIEGAKTINRKLQGQRANGSATAAPATTEGTASTPATPAPATASSSQQSYDNLVEHFNGLIELVNSHTEYNPNETELKVATLQTYLTELKAANTNVVNTNTTWSNSRISRDNLLYADTTGLVDVALDVKAYIKSVFNSTSPQYAQVSGIEFKRAKG